VTNTVLAVQGTGKLGTSENCGPGVVIPRGSTIISFRRGLADSELFGGNLSPTLFWSYEDDRWV
jgi:hypothetical protein